MLSSTVRAASPASRLRPRFSTALAAHRGYGLDISVAVVVSVLVRLPWVIFIRHGLVWDSTFYYWSAKSIAAGHGYSILGHPTAFFPVGWPAFLGGVFALTGPSIVAILVVNLILWSATTGLVYALARRMGGRATGVVAALLVATSPTLTLYVLRAYSEALFIPLLLLVCLLLTARRETPTLRAAAWAGVCLGLAILVRSTAVVLPFLLPLWLLLRRPVRESWRAAAVLCSVSCLVVAPWIVRNELVMHSFAISTNGGYTLWSGTKEGQHAPLAWAISSAHDEVRQNSELTHKSVSFALHHTGTWLGLVPGKFRGLMGWSDRPIRNALRFQYGPDPRGPRVYMRPRTLHGAERTLVRGALHHEWIFRGWHYAFWVLGGVATALAAWRRKPAASIVLLLVAFWIGFHSVFFFGDKRFMISVTPLVAAPLAWMLVRTVSAFPRSKND
jgi:4-amino-4-deoxy-L-arabinose transferase-like glycosyltransferase